MKSVFLFLFLTIAAERVCLGQFIRSLKAVSPELEGKLKNDLALLNPAPVRVATLLELGRLYGSRPYPRAESQRLALSSVRKARALASAVHMTPETNQAQFLLGLLFIRSGLLDSAVRQLGFVNDTSRCDLLEEIAYRYRFIASNGFSAARPKVAEYVGWEQRLADSLKDARRQLWAEKAVAGMHGDVNRPGSGEELLAVERKMETLDAGNLHYAWSELASWALVGGDYDRSLYYSQQTLNCLQHTGDSAEKADFLRFHAMILRRVGKHEESIRYGQMAVDQYSRQYGDADITATLWIITDEMVKLKRVEEAKEYFQRMETRYPADNLSDSIMQYYAAGHFYRRLKDYSRGESAFLRGFSLQRRAGRLDFGSFRDMGQLYVEAGQYDKARGYLLEALNRVDSSRMVAELSHLYYCLYKADSATGYYKDAMRFMYLNKKYDDVALTQAKTAAIEKYTAQFGLEKKEAELKLADAKLKRSQLLRDILLLGVVLILAGGTMFYYQLRKNRKANRIISEKNRELQAMLEEKNWLLKEVHHRVKNNLHTVICLLESQAMYLKDDALNAIEKSQNRIYAMSLIHQKLYQDDAVRTVDMSVYLREFVQYLQRGFDAAGIEFRLEVDPVKLELAQAIPLALMINEAVTNSIKYAFPGAKKGIIRLVLAASDDSIRLVVADDGVGFDPLADDTTRTSLGLQLIRGLCGELKGMLYIDGSNGARITVEFSRGLMANSQEDHKEFSYAI